MANGNRILAFAGSTREKSFNKMLVKIAATGARSAGAEVTELDLQDYPLPLFDQDLEAEGGLPDNGKRLRELFLKHDGLLISSPEYNSSITAVLKNTIDWVSRPQPGDKPLVCFAGKCAAIMAASPGALGGLRGLVHLRAILGDIQVLVLPDQVAIPNATETFAADGSLTDAKKQASVSALGEKLARTLAKLGG
jgi:NAD(P)H-dependent FMN reductase